MSIAALPPQAVQAIGSSQVLTDSASLVKELVDNALDAQATSITVEISTNTLDVIQLKDNGHGIAPVDRSLVCKRHCTSKIKDLEDLARIGGASLGFRGEALASAVEMSGSLVVTTRIVGEATAVSLQVSQKGEVENEERISQAVGTTVRVTDFLKSLPVRRQTALKDATKQLAKIKRTLQAYALARPSVRMSLKVLKTKNDKSNWMYVPKSEASVADAAVKIIGKRASDQCQWTVWCPDSPSIPTASTCTELAADSDSTYKVEAFIPKANCDSPSISNVGHYITVDARPVSSSRGTLKQMVQLFKSYLRSSASTTVDQKIIDPFLCMNLVCPPRSYDANVEPAKDDILFTNSSRVLTLVESFLRSHYGDLKPKDKLTTRSNRLTPQPRNFDLLLARKPPPATVQPFLPSPTSSLRQQQPLDGDDPIRIEKPVRLSDEDHVEGGENDVGDTGSRRSQIGEGHLERSSRPGLTNTTGQIWRNGMYADDEDGEPINTGLTTQNQSSEEAGEDEGDIRSITVTNPWTLAKLNAPIRSQKPNGQLDKESVRNQQLLNPAKAPEDMPGDLSTPLRILQPDGAQYLLTPAKSQDASTNEQSSPDTFPYPMKAWGKAHREIVSSPDRVLSEKQPSSLSVLDTWVRRPPVQPREELFIPDFDNTASRQQRDFVSAAALPQGTPLSAIPDISQRPRQKAAPRKQQQRQSNITKPFTLPVQDPHRVLFHGPEASSSLPPKPNQRRKQQDSLAADIPHNPPQDLGNDPILAPFSPPPSSPPIHPGLAITMDYERRKAEATAARRAFLRQQQQPQQQQTL
ncbi:MAG: hypothetical protein Q9184_006345, partial [Pyrenodesmia sp. 2 TL-2023]